MIVWIASFPRSGNTLFRIALNQLFGVTTSTIYEHDYVAQRLGAELVGYRQHEGTYEDLRRSSRYHFVKTHQPCDSLVHSNDRAIYLVRDGRDSVVSWARQKAEQPGRTFEAELQSLVLNPNHRGAGAWGTNALSWMNYPNTRTTIRFEDLISDPAKVVKAAIASLQLRLSGNTETNIQNFDELNAIDPKFFRRGVAGTYRDEMPAELQSAFLASADNHLALKTLSYV